MTNEEQLRLLRELVTVQERIIEEMQSQIAQYETVVSWTERAINEVWTNKEKEK